MKDKPAPYLEMHRITKGILASNFTFGMNGAFEMVHRGQKLMVVSSDGRDPIAEGWEHVSVSHERRCPTWDEMAWIKGQFWEPYETVLQFHPNEKEYVNCHPFCLHLWKHKDGHKLPPSALVGPKK